MTIQLQKVQCPYGNTTGKKYNIRIPIQLHKVQYTYDNRTAKGTVVV